MRAEEGDESIDELADEAAKTKKELRESTKTGERSRSSRGTPTGGASDHRCDAGHVEASHVGHLSW